MSAGKIKVMTDTNSGLTVEEGNSLGVAVLPMPVIVDGRDCMEGVDITQDELFRAMKAGKEVHSSQPAIGSLMEMWDEILETYDEIIYLPMSSGLSGSYATAAQFAKEYEGRVEVADNHRISVSLRESVLDALALVQKGLCAKEIRERLEKNAYESSIYITVNTLENLKKSGRVTAAGAMIATVMNLKPILTIQGEKLDAFAKIRGMKSAEKRMIEAIQKDLDTRFKDVPRDRIRLATAGTIEDPADIKAWRNQVGEAFPGFEVYYGALSCSIATHVGVGTEAIALMVLDR